MSNVLILADFISSKATKTNAELATAAARIGEVTAVVLAPAGKGAAMAADINKGPVSKIVVVESDAFVNNGVAAAADVLAQIIAFGKHGGQEVNYSSDLDLVFVLLHKIPHH